MVVKMILYMCIIQVVDKQLFALAGTLAAWPHRLDRCARSFDLGRYPGSLPILPTLNGWLLGYPVAYLLTQDTIDAAARHLSSTRLALHMVRAECLPLQVRFSWHLDMQLS